MMATAVRAPDPTGARFGNLIAQWPAGLRVGYQPEWLCLCDCGTLCVKRLGNLRSGNTRSCGCLPQPTPTHTVKHNHSRAGRRTPEYRTWQHIIQRCSNPKDNRWSYYGGRGIKVCDRWRTSFVDFLADMGPKPSPEFSIDRINNDGNYEPGNCRWANASQQAFNRRKAHQAQEDVHVVP
jgi:hypothetical protein